MKFHSHMTGTDARILFPDGAKPYSSETLKLAVTATEKRSADLGGTELYKPLKSILTSKTQRGFSRQIFLLTDGEVRVLQRCRLPRFVRSHSNFECKNY
jgi:hypothetical protein